MPRAATIVRFRSIIQFLPRRQTRHTSTSSVSVRHTTHDQFIDIWTFALSAVKQTGPPKILFKEKAFFVGDNLVANCTTTRSKPHPHITWLINGKKVKRNKSCWAWREARNQNARKEWKKVYIRSTSTTIQPAHTTESQERRLLTSTPEPVSWIS